MAWRITPFLGETRYSCYQDYDVYNPGVSISATEKGKVGNSYMVFEGSDVKWDQVWEIHTSKYETMMTTLRNSPFDHKNMFSRNFLIEVEMFAIDSNRDRAWRELRNCKMYETGFAGMNMF